MAAECPLERIRPVSEDYARVPVAEAFTWRDWARDLEAGEWYLVAFRSIYRQDADERRLREYDDRAFQEAKRAPGFVHYLRGEPNRRRECLSFCLWDSRTQARDAARSPRHLAATLIIKDMYESYELEFFRVRKREGTHGLEFEPYDPPAPHSPDGQHVIARAIHRGVA